ncbi:MAG: competence protein ComEC [Thermosediminibacterales bacterium]|nr:competence protein ComEC [Thermosediminibacterales bacterium]MDK2835767.1 competence protein ComEC [Thermosediminibacterales bacterium]
MRRPFLYLAIVYSLGIVFGKVFNLELFQVFLGTVILAVLTGIMLYKRLNSKPFFLILIFLTGIMSFVFHSYINTGSIIEFVGKDVVLEGIICEDPVFKKDRVVYTLQTQKVEIGRKSLEVSGRVRVTVKITDFQKNNMYRFGDLIKIKGKLCEPSGQRNPGGFNYSDFLFQRGISLMVYTRDFNTELLGRNELGFFKGIMFKLRDRLSAAVTTGVKSENAAILNGILFGLKSNISEKVYSCFADAGIIHILAVSGLHVWFITAIFYWLFGKLKIRSEYLKVCLILLGIFCYVFITGARPSVIRAGIMAGMTVLGRYSLRQTDMLTSLSLAGLVILVFNPMSLFSIGFQLSFAATFGIIFLFSYINSLFRFLPEKIRGLVSVTTAAQLGVLPLTLYYFNTVSLVSVVTNLLIVPVVGLIVGIGFFSAVLGQIHHFVVLPLNKVNDVLLDYMVYMAKVLSDLPYSTVDLPAPSPLSILLYYLLILAIVGKSWEKLPVQNFKKVAVITVLIVLNSIIWGFVLTPFDEIEVVFLDVGEGDSIFIQTPGHKTFMIDGGGLPDYYSGDFSIGEDVLIPFLKRKGIKKLDGIFLTHSHDDHLKGLIPVVRCMKVESVFLGPYNEPTDSFLEFISELKNKGVPLYHIWAGENIILDHGIILETIYPPENWGCSKEAEKNINNSSLVLRMIYEDVEILFTGDLESEGEEYILNSNFPIQSDVLKVAHHGSKTSTSEKFLDKIQPDWAVISVGLNNRFGHPDEEVVERLKARGIKIFRTDRDGAVIMKTDGKRISFDTVIKIKNNNHEIRTGE